VALNRSTNSGGWRVLFSPNPIGDKLTLTVLQNGLANKNWQAELFDVSGRCVMETTGFGQATLNLQNLPSGSYVMRILSGKERVTTRTFFKY
jgi:hypothetical protein